MRARLLGAAALLVFTGCSDSNAGSGGTGGTGGAGGGIGANVCDGASIDECRINQQGCVLQDGAPACVVCDVGQFASPEGGCAPLEGEIWTHTFPENTTPAGGELLGMCRSWTLNNPEPLWINAVEIQQDEASHHSNWIWVPDDEFDGPDGIWPCSERNYDQLSGALAGGVVYAQSTQANHEVQKFPDRAAFRLSANVRIIADIHTLNTTAEEVTGDMTISLYEVPEEEVTIKLAPFHIDYRELTIQPMSTSRFTGECDLRSGYGGGPLELEIYYLLPHTHALGTRMFVEGFGGSQDGLPIIDLQGFNGEARGRSYDPPIDLSGAHGLRFGCEFDNPTAEEVNWGFDDQEMCEALGFAASPIAFESRIHEALAGEMDGQTHTFTGACDTLAIPWKSKVE